ncbi:MAG: pantoate--beta-alanine ligase [Actinobacteria bacterium]|nr:pantoate--beta-alanine ligase [Actinomycetota bacterium]
MSRPIVLNTVAKVDAWAEKETTPIAAVLTMGALHQGHAELVRYAKANTPNGTRVIATIFVNPTQFNNSSDLAEYPRTLDSDLDTLQSAGADAVFVPDVAQMYPNGLEVNPPMEPGAIGDVLEGKARPGHFRGMLTVVERLLSITHANYSFFGEKDFQQLTLVKSMVAATKMPIEIVGVPTVRDEFGIALSSRNRRLSEKAIEHAKLIPTAMNKAAEVFLSSSSIDEAEAAGKAILEQSGKFEVEYFEIRSNDLVLLPTVGNARVFVAVNIEDVRLIDNLEIAK